MDRKAKETLKQQVSARLNSLTQEQITIMTDSEVLVLFAEDAAICEGEITETWLWIASVYHKWNQEMANVLIMQEFSDEYLLDPELCRQMLIDAIPYRNQRRKH